jgi:hypothetical protein
MSVILNNQHEKYYFWYLLFKMADTKNKIIFFISVILNNRHKITKLWYRSVKMANSKNRVSHSWTTFALPRVKMISF